MNVIKIKTLPCLLISRGPIVYESFHRSCSHILSSICYFSGFGISIQLTWNFLWKCSSVCGVWRSRIDLMKCVLWDKMCFSSSKIPLLSYIEARFRTGNCQLWILGSLCISCLLVECDRTPVQTGEVKGIYWFEELKCVEWIALWGHQDSVWSCSLLDGFGMG